MLLKSCSPGSILFCRIICAHRVYHLPHLGYVLSRPVKCRWTIRLLCRVRLALLLSHAGKRERQAHTRHWQAELTLLLPRKRYVQSLLVYFKSVPIRAYTLHVEALATDWAVWRLRLFTLSAVRLGGMRIGVRCALGSSCVCSCVFSS